MNLEELGEWVVTDVDPDLLTKTGRGTEETGGYLSGTPFVDHLEAGERLGAVLISHTTAPIPERLPETRVSLDGYRSISGITTERILAVTGTPDGNQVIELPLHAVREFTWREQAASPATVGLLFKTDEGNLTIFDESGVDRDAVSRFLENAITDAKERHLSKRIDQFETAVEAGDGETALAHFRRVLSERQELLEWKSARTVPWIDAGDSADLQRSLLSDLHDVSVRLERVPSAADYLEHDAIDPEQVEREFPRLSEVLTRVDEGALDDTSATDSSGTDDTRAETLVEELQSLSDDLGHAPLRPDINDHSDYSYQTFVSEFGSFDDALAAAGIDLQASLLDEIERVAEKLGRKPTSGDIDDHAAYSSGTYSTRFNSWADALERADLSSLDDGRSDSSGTDREEMLSLIQSLYESLERVPKTTDLPETAAYQPHDFVSVFGSWDEALEAAGIDQEQELLDEIRRVAEEIGAVPNTGDMNQYGDYASGTYSTRFGSWADAVERAELPSFDDSQDDSPEDEREEMLSLIQSLYESLGRIPKTTDIPETVDYRQYEFVSTFGSWDEALEAAGIDQEQELLDEIRRVAEEIEAVPNSADMDRHGDYWGSRYSEYFGSWSEAVERADLSGIESEEYRRTELIEILRSRYDELGRTPQTPDLWKVDRVAEEDFLTEFGSWGAALEAADVGRARVLRDDLRSVAETVERVPAKGDVDRHGEYSVSEYTEHFGSWAAAVEAADLGDDDSNAPDESETTEPTREQLLAELRWLDREIDGLPKATDMQQRGEFAVRLYTQEFGSWEEALAEAGIDKGERLLSEVERVWRQLGHRPSTAEMNEHGRVSSTMVGQYFDSWGAACDRVAAEVADTDADPDPSEMTSVLSAAPELTFFESIGEGDEVDAYLAKVVGTILWVDAPKEFKLRTKDVVAGGGWIDVMEGHGSEGDFERGNWYLFRNLRGYVDNEEGGGVRLQSTSAFETTDLGSELDRETLRAEAQDRGLLPDDVGSTSTERQSVTEKSESERDGSSTEAEPEGDDSAAGGEDDIVGRLMDDLDW